MGEAQSSLKDFTQQADIFQERAITAHSEAQARIIRRRQEMEQNLTELDEQTAGVIAKNDKLRGRIRELSNLTADMKASAKRWESSNLFLREAMGALLKKLITVRGFIEETLNTTNTDGAAELEAVKNIQAEAPSLEDFQRSFGQGGTEAEKVSLLATHGVVGTVSTNFWGPSMTSAAVVVPKLASQLRELVDAADMGESQLTGRFIALRELGDARLQAAQTEHDLLMAHVDELVSTEKGLKEIIGNMKVKHINMSHRLGAVRTFAMHASNQTARAARKAVAAQQQAMKLADGNSTKDQA